MCPKRLRLLPVREFVAAPISHNTELASESKNCLKAAPRIGCEPMLAVVVILFSFSQFRIYKY